MQQTHTELISELYTNGCITEDQRQMLLEPNSVVIVADIKNWLRSLDENVVYDTDN